MCGAMETELWLERQIAKELRCKHHQIVYTSSAELRPLWRWNRKLFTNLYFRSAWHSLRDLLADPPALARSPTGRNRCFPKLVRRTRRAPASPLYRDLRRAFPDGEVDRSKSRNANPVPRASPPLFRGKHVRARGQRVHLAPAQTRPEKGTHCARVYGLYHSAKRESLNQARALFGQAPYEPITEPPDVHELLHRMMPDFTGDLCPKCHARLVTVYVVRHNRSPPMEVAA